MRISVDFLLVDLPADGTAASTSAYAVVAFTFYFAVLRAYGTIFNGYIREFRNACFAMYSSSF